MHRLAESAGLAKNKGLFLATTVFIRLHRKVPPFDLNRRPKPSGGSGRPKNLDNDRGHCLGQEPGQGWPGLGAWKTGFTARPSSFILPLFPPLCVPRLFRKNFGIWARGAGLSRYGWQM